MDPAIRVVRRRIKAAVLLGIVLGNPVLLWTKAIHHKGPLRTSDGGEPVTRAQNLAHENADMRKQKNELCAFARFIVLVPFLVPSEALCD